MIRLRVAAVECARVLAFTAGMAAGFGALIVLTVIAGIATGLEVVFGDRGEA